MASRKEREAEELRRKRLARRRFKTLVRLVLYNRTWLLDMEEQQQLTSNVKKNIAMVIRPPRKFGLLTLTDKSLLRTHHFCRSVKDRKHLVTLFANLTCFASFSPRVRARLVSVMNFLDLQRNRTIVREGDMPQMVYFIIYGEVEVYKKKFDAMTQTYEPKLLGMQGTGDCIGDMEFLEDFETRQCTAITANDTELLVIQSDDFERILKPLMVEQWEERKAAIKALQYFEFFNPEQLVSACKLCILRQYEALETIYYEDKGLASYVYFVVSGECMILQCLKIRSRQKDGNKTYELIEVEHGNDSNIFEDMTEKEIMKMMLGEKMALDTSESSSKEDENEMARPVQPKPIINIEALCAAKGHAMKAIRDSESVMPEEEETSEKHKSDFDPTSRSSFENASYENATESSIEVEDSIYNMKTATERQSEYTIKSIKPANESRSLRKSSLQVDRSIENQQKEVVLSAKASKITIKSQKSRRYSQQTDGQSKSERGSNDLSASNDSSESTSGASSKSKVSEDHNGRTENHFIDVGAMTFGGIFGLGEKMEHRVIMARTTVQCLMLPRFFLLEKEQNPGNIWQRRRFYLDCTIPSRQNLFKNFLSTLKWQKFKQDLIQNTVRVTQKTNPTKVEDVPIMGRITEDR